MAKVGDAISLTINGTKFSIPKETTPVVFDGGETVTETQGYGDGTADAVTSIVVPKITGLRVKISSSNEDIFMENKKKTDIPFVLQTVAKTYELTGCIVGEFGVDSTKGITEEFEVHVTDGTGIRKS